MQVKIWQFFHSKITPVFSKKEHLFSGHVADMQRTSCILCGITLLLYACYRQKKWLLLHSLPAKKHKKNLAIFPQLIFSLLLSHSR